MKGLFFLAMLCTWFTAQSQTITNVAPNGPTTIAEQTAAFGSWIYIPVSADITVSAAGPISVQFRTYYVAANGDSIIQSRPMITQTFAAAGTYTVLDTIRTMIAVTNIPWDVTVTGTNTMTADASISYPHTARYPLIERDFMSGICPPTSFDPATISSLHVDWNYTYGYGASPQWKYPNTYTVDTLNAIVYHTGGGNTPYQTVIRNSGFVYANNVNADYPFMYVGDSLEIQGGMPVSAGTDSVVFHVIRTVYADGDLAETKTSPTHKVVNDNTDWPSGGATPLTHEVSITRANAGWGSQDLGWNGLGDVNMINLDSFQNGSCTDLVLDLLGSSVWNGNMINRDSFRIIAQVLSRTGVWRFIEPYQNLQTMTNDIEAHFHKPDLQCNMDLNRYQAVLPEIEKLDSMLVVYVEYLGYHGPHLVASGGTTVLDTVFFTTSQPNTVLCLDTLCVDSLTITVGQTQGPPGTVDMDFTFGIACDSLTDQEFYFTWQETDSLGVITSHDTIVQLDSMYSTTPWRSGGGPYTYTFYLPYDTTNTILIDYQIIMVFGGNNIVVHSMPQDSGQIRLGTVITGIQPIAESFSSRIYPNPTTSDFSLEITEVGEYNVQIHDMQGRMIHQAHVTNGVHVLPLKQASGMYVVRIISSDGTSESKIITKK